MPVYNSEKFLDNSITDILNQTYKNIEIIVINDCSIETEYYEYNWKDNDIIIIHLDIQIIIKMTLRLPSMQYHQIILM